MSDNHAAIEELIWSHERLRVALDTVNLARPGLFPFIPKVLAAAVKADKDARKAHAEEKRAWTVAGILRSHEGCTEWYFGTDPLPELYGYYAVYDGFTCRVGGVTRNLRESLTKLRTEFGSLRMPIFIWKADLDGSIRKHLDGPHEPEPKECSECGREMD